jgi:hypothetical protein
MLVIDTQYDDDEDDDTSNLERLEETACVPIVDGQETDDLITISLPEHVAANNRALLERGRLYMNITDAEFFRGDIIIKPETQFNAIHGRSNSILGTRASPILTMGTKTIAIIRIHANDKSPTVTKEQLENLFNTSEINIRTQYDACSHGQLDWTLAEAGVIDVHLDQPIADFGMSGGPIVTAAQVQLKTDLNIEDISSLGDRILFCTPRGPGSWVASAGMNHWRAQFHDDWCLSLTATMHEIGHTIGLVHANENGTKYGDKTGIMTKSFRQTDWPRRCFDGRSNHILGWYKDRELIVDYVQDDPKLIDLAAFVDYGKAAEDEPVLVTLPEEIFLQYNRAKSFHSGSGEKKDTVIVAQMTKSGSELLAGLKPGERFEFLHYQGWGRTLVVEVCAEIAGNENSPDAMMISVGMGRSGCPEQSAEKETEAPVNESESEKGPKFIISAPSRSAFFKWFREWKRGFFNRRNQSS